MLVNKVLVNQRTYVEEVGQNANSNPNKSMLYNIPSTIILSHSNAIFYGIKIIDPYLKK